MTDRPWEALDLQNQRSGTNTDNLWPWERQDLAAPTLGDGPSRRSPFGGSGAAQRAAEERWQNLSPWERVGTGFRSVASGVPILRNAIETTPNLETYRTARPITTAVEEGVGHTLPYAAAAAVYPPMMATLPAGATTGAIVEGADAALAGNNVPLAMSTGALSAIPGAIITKGITPKSSQAAQIAKFERESARIRRHQENIDVLNHLHRQEGSTPIRRELDVSRLPMPEHPPLQIPPIQLPEVSRSLGITNLNPTLENMLFGGGVGYMIGDPSHALTGAAAGYALPRVANAGISGINAGLRTRPGRWVGERGFGYINNDILSPQNRALLNALGLGATDEAAQTLTGQ